MITNSNGSNNTGVGAFALLNTTSSGSTAVGVEAMKSNTSGIDNTALGKSAMLKNTSGIFNTAAGNEAMSENVTGNFNTAFGRSSLLINTAGSNNTALGYNAYNSNGTTFSNSTALGANSIITASNQIRTGNTAVTSIGGKVGWSTLSDGRFKTNVQQNIPGLNFINKLKPVSYQYNLVKLNQFTSRGVTTPEDEKAMSVAAAFTYSGFIAQDVEKTAKELGYDFSGVDAPKNDKDVYGLRYAEFVVPLVKAVQELSKQNEQLTIDNGQLKKTSEQLTMDNGQLKTQAADQEKRIAKLEALMQQLLNTKSTAPCPPLAGK